MIDLNMKPRKKEEEEYEPNGLEITAMIITIAVWVAMIIGWMAW